MVKEVQGVYNNIDEAVEKVESLNKRGYHQDDITILANREVENDLPWNVDAEVSTSDTDSTRHTDRREDDKGLWESIKSAFVVDDVENDNYANSELADVRETHRADLDAGKVIVLVDSDADVNRGDYNQNENYDHRADTGVVPGATSTTDHEHVDHHHDERPGKEGLDRHDHEHVDHRDNHTETENLQLKEEKLHVDKEEEQTGEVHVDKRVVEETQTVDVPVKREEVTISRKPVDGKTTDEGISDDGEEIVIPTKQEHVNISKETEVMEEVEVKKEVHEDTETVEEKVRREELDVDGDYNDRDNRTDLDNRDSLMSDRGNDELLDDNRGDLDNRDDLDTRDGMLQERNRDDLNDIDDPNNPNTPPRL